MGAQKKFEEKIVDKDKKLLDRAAQVVNLYRDKEYVDYKEYLHLYNKLKKLMEEIYFIFEISDTYQDQLLNVQESLKEKIAEKDAMEKKLNKKIEELKTARTELEQANKKLEQLSTRDQLTGLYNRREFEKVIEKEWRYAIREQEPIAMIMIDIDNFKAFNDNYGHLAGDNCLQKISKAMQKSLKRPRDFIARFGGEEFVAILPETDSEGAKHTAERIRKDVYGLNIPHKYSKVKEYVTISLGIGFTDVPEMFVFEEVLDKADEALYEAKESGKNKYCFEQLDF